MSQERQTSATYIQHLSILHGGMLIMQIIFVLIAFWVRKDQVADMENGLNAIFYILIPVIALGVVALSNFLIKKRLEMAQSLSSLSEKLLTYRSIQSFKYTLSEGPSILAIVAFYLTGNYMFLLLFLVFLGYFFSIKPSLDKVIDELNLVGQERAKMNNADAVVVE